MKEFSVGRIPIGMTAIPGFTSTLQPVVLVKDVLQISAFHIGRGEFFKIIDSVYDANEVKNGLIVSSLAAGGQ